MIEGVLRQENKILEQEMLIQKRVGNFERRHAAFIIRWKGHSK